MRHNFLMVGQSNMSGRGLLSQVPTYEHAARIFMYDNGGNWTLASEPIDGDKLGADPISDDGASAGAGIGLAFANQLIESGAIPEGDTVGLIPAAKGSTLINQWRRFWTRGSLYGSAIARAWAAEDQGRLSGILWWQGEGDTVLVADANAWRERFSNLMANMRTDLQDLALPIAFAQLNNLKHTRHPYWNTVRNAQASISMKNVVMVSTDGVPFKSDNVHATTAGYKIIGERFADAIAPLL
jgi:hypothetical protein